MTILLFANNARTTLAAPISSTATTATLASGTGSLFPSPSTGQAFKLTFTDAATGLLNEIVLCTARSGDTVTIVRGQEGTTAQSWLANDLAGMYFTAGTINNNIQIDQSQIGTYNTATATGTANALTATIPSNLNYIPTNFTFTLQAAAANTGAATLNLTIGSTLTGAKPIVKSNNQPLIAGDIANAGYPMWLAWSPVYGAYVLMNPGTGESTALSPAQLQQQYYTYAVATGGSDTIAVTIPSSLTTLTDGLQFSFRSAYNNGTSTPNLTLTLGSTATPTKTIVKGNNQPLTVGDIPGSGSVCEVIYSSLYGAWILLNPYANTPAGSVVQTQFTQSTTGQYITGGSPTTALSLTFTPKYATSKILVQMVCPALVNGEGTLGAYMQIARGSTPLTTSMMGSGFNNSSGTGTGNDTAIPNASCMTSQLLDSPNTASPVTYNMLVGVLQDEPLTPDTEYYTVYIGDAVISQWGDTNLGYPTCNYSIMIQEIKQ